MCLTHFRLNSPIICEAQFENFYPVNEQSSVDDTCNKDIFDYWCFIFLTPVEKVVIEQRDAQANDQKVDVTEMSCCYDV